MSNQLPYLKHWFWLIQQYTIDFTFTFSVAFGDWTSLIYSTTDMHVPALLFVNFLPYLAWYINTYVLNCNLMFFYEQLLLTFHSVRPKKLGLRAPLVEWAFFQILCGLRGLDWVQICVGTVVAYSVFPSDSFHKLLTCINQLFSIVRFS